MRGPSIAGLEGSVPPTRRVHLIFPVAASIANVVPENPFTYSSPSQ